MWGSVIGAILGIISLWAFASHIAEKVEERLEDRLNDISNKLDNLTEKNFHFDSSDDGW